MIPTDHTSSDEYLFLVFSWIHNKQLIIDNSIWMSKEAQKAEMMLALNESHY